MITRLKVVLGISSALSLFILIVAFSATVSSLSSYSKISYRLFSLICHQERGLCVHINNNPMPICSRCLGIYSGILITSLSLLFLLKKTGFIIKLFNKIKLIIPFFFLSWMLLFIESRLATEKIINQSHIRRFITGLIAGCSLLLLIVFLLNKLFLMMDDQRKT
jgi:uncharacterized membrane protein